MTTLSSRSLAAALCLAALLRPAPARADLADYVKKADDAYSWKLKATTEAGGSRTYEIDLVSQKWHDVVWDHKLMVYLPKGVKPAKTMLLLNTGGTPGLGSHLMGAELARRCNAPVAILFGVPKQPLFGGKTEDALIAETFVRYLKDKDESWPLLFPMVKSVVRAMDALQAFTKDEWKETAESFVVTGASKRGWTTWLTAATGDKRVKAIAPMVIDTLNMKPQMEQQKRDFGKPSAMVHDYVERGLVPLPDTDEARRLWSIIDPYFYRDKLTMPKLILLGNNDPYWTTDALNLYWDGLKGPKYVTYVPNAGHKLEQDGKKDLTRVRDALAAFVRYQVADKPMPKLSWKYDDDADGRLRLTVEASPAPKSARLWVAAAPTRDFRGAKWEERKATVGKDKVVGTVEPPKEGCLAFYGDVEYEVGGLSYHLCTQIRIAGKPAGK